MTMGPAVVAATGGGAGLWQAMLASPFLMMGSWCLVAPAAVEELTLRPEHRHNSPTSRLLMRCFGCQAVLSGLAISTMAPTRQFFAAFGVATLPFFGFNYWGYFSSKMFTELLVLDFIGNVILVGSCIAGYRALSKPTVSL